MPCNARWKKLLASAAALLAGGSSFVFIPSCETVLKTVNPCANIFEFCDANDISLLFADVPDYDLDPSCTVPFLTGCSGGNIFPNNALGSRP